MRRKNASKMLVTLLMLLLVPGQVTFAQSPQDDQPVVHITQVDTSSFPQVKVYLSVTDAEGVPVGVEADRLVLSENGVPIQPQQLMGQADVVEQLSTLLVFDVSGSMNSYGKLGTAKAAAQAYIEQMRPGDQVGLLSFNTAVTLVQPLTQDGDALASAVEALKAKDDTSMYDALVQAVAMLAAQDGRTAVIALTDGMDNRSVATLEDVLAGIGPRGTTISTVGLGDPAQEHATTAGLDVPALGQIAARTGGEYAYANDGERLTALYQHYARTLQSEYVLTYTSPSTLRDGLSRELSVTLREMEAEVEPLVYNPGGLVPEVEQPAHWALFGGVLMGLIALLFLPAVLERWTAGRVARVSSRKPEKRIRLKD